MEVICPDDLEMPTSRDDFRIDCLTSFEIGLAVGIISPFYGQKVLARLTADKAVFLRMLAQPAPGKTVFDMEWNRLKSVAEEVPAACKIDP